MDVGKLLVIGQVVFKLPRVMSGVLYRSITPLVSRDIIEGPAAIIIDSLVNDIGSQSSSQFQTFHDTDIGIHVPQHGLCLDMEKSVRDDVQGVSAAFHTWIIFIPAPSSVKIFYRDNGKRFQHLSHSDDTSAAKRVDLAFTLVVIAQTSPYFQPILDLAVKHKTGSISFQPGFSHKAFLISIA